MTVEALHSLQPVPEPVFIHNLAGNIPALEPPDSQTDPAHNQKRPAREPARGVLKLPGQKGTLAPPVDVTLLIDEKSFQKATYPPRQNFFNALLEVQEQFIRTFEEISEIPTQLGALFSESAQELAQETHPASDFPNRQEQQKEDTSRLAEDIQFHKLQKRIDFVQQGTASTQDKQELAVI